MTKLNYAYQLMGTQGRGLAAEKLGLEALADLEKSKNIYGVAEAHTFLGLFYKNSSYREHRDFYIKHNEYDPTATKSIKHFELAAKHLKKKEITGVCQRLCFLWVMDTVQIMIMLMVAKKYQESLSVYNSDRNVFRGRTHPHNPVFKSFDAMIEAFIVKHCESGV